MRKPYNQGIQTIFRDYSLVLLWQSTKAASRALRNSDYANPNIKRDLLKEIAKSWKQIAKICFAISPILAEKGVATFDGQGFFLLDGFGDDPQKRWFNVLMDVSSNIVGRFKNDIASQKMGPLLFDNLNTESDDIKRHQIAILIVVERPKNWKNAIQWYIDKLDKKSYYLLDLYNVLQTQYNYSTMTVHDIRDTKYLIKATLSKHNFGTISKVNKISDTAFSKRVEPIN